MEAIQTEVRLFERLPFFPIEYRELFSFLLEQLIAVGSPSDSEDTL